MNRILIIQTAFIGDVVLATGVAEALHNRYPAASIDFLLRKGNEQLFSGHPFLHQVLIWDKKKSKFKNLLRSLQRIRRTKYDCVVNVNRFFSSGLLTAFSKAPERIGFRKNPFSLFFTRRVSHQISSSTNALHETERNAALISHLTHEHAKPRLYPGPGEELSVLQLKHTPYITLSPASVWFTKQYPSVRWVSFLDHVPPELNVYLLGAASDTAMAESIIAKTQHPCCTNLCGKLSFLASAALMRDALMNYVNDSAPLHFASATNAPVTAVYCSTLPAFGFGPLSEISFVVEVQEELKCRPCGLHGRKKCPMSHFHCALRIQDEQLLEALPLLPTERQ